MCYVSQMELTREFGVMLIFSADVECTENKGHSPDAFASKLILKI